MSYTYFYDHIGKIFGRKDQDGNIETRKVEINSTEDFLREVRIWEAE